LEDGEWCVIATLNGAERGRVPPFADVEPDFGAMLAID
jgi:hypothetical protein